MSLRRRPPASAARGLHRRCIRGSGIVRRRMAEKPRIEIIVAFVFQPLPDAFYEIRGQKSGDRNQGTAYPFIIEKSVNCPRIFTSV